MATIAPIRSVCFTNVNYPELLQIAWALGVVVQNPILVLVFVQVITRQLNKAYGFEQMLGTTL